jgi:hypothetical protein
MISLAVICSACFVTGLVMGVTVATPGPKKAATRLSKAVSRTHQPTTYLIRGDWA